MPFGTDLMNPWLNQGVSNGVQWALPGGGTTSSQAQSVTAQNQAAYGPSGTYGGYIQGLGTANAQAAQAAPAQQDPGQAVLQNYADLYSKAQQDVANYGTTEQAQLANSYAQQSAQQQQGLQSRGLGNTTVANAVQTGLGQAQNLAQTNLAEQVGQYKTDTAGQFGLAGAGAQLGIYQQQTGLNAQMQQQANQINAQAALQRQEIAAQQAQQAAQFGYATALAGQQYGYNQNLQAQQLGLSNQYQKQLLQLQALNQQAANAKSFIPMQDTANYYGAHI